MLAALLVRSNSRGAENTGGYRSGRVPHYRRYSPYEVAQLKQALDLFDRHSQQPPTRQQAKTAVQPSRHIVQAFLTPLATPVAPLPLANAASAAVGRRVSVQSDEFYAEFIKPLIDAEMAQVVVHLPVDGLEFYRTLARRAKELEILLLMFDAT